MRICVVCHISKAHLSLSQNGTAAISCLQCRLLCKVYIDKEWVAQEDTYLHRCSIMEADETVVGAWTGKRNKRKNRHSLKCWNLERIELVGRDDDLTMEELVNKSTSATPAEIFSTIFLLIVRFAG